ncbi:MAG: flagellin hook IN motif-containing protein, partial [Pseudomonadota bacterium]
MSEISSIAAPDRLSSLRTAAAVQRPVSVSFPGVRRGNDAADVGSIQTLFDRLARARSNRGLSPEFDVEVRRTTSAIRSALNSAPGSSALSGGTLPLPTLDGAGGLRSGISVGPTTSAISGVRVNGLKLAQGESFPVEVQVVNSAQQGQLYLSLGAFGTPSTPGSLDINGTGTAANSVFSVQISGALGSVELSFSSGQSLTQVVSAINTFAGQTGVEAVTSGLSFSRGGVILRSSGLGSDEFVSVRVTNNADLQVAGGGTQGLGVYQFGENDLNFVELVICWTRDSHPHRQFCIAYSSVCLSITFAIH